MSDELDGAELLKIYLEDHLAGATAGAARAHRLAEAEEASTDGPTLAKLANEVDADREALLTLMEAAGVEPSKVKAGLAAVGEKLGALKPNGRAIERSPLSTVVELEALQMAVRGKRSLWESLTTAMPVRTAIDIDALIGRADDQLATLSELHARRAPSVFTTGS
jgi:hypothetical protein